MNKTAFKRARTIARSVDNEGAPGMRLQRAGLAMRVHSSSVDPTSSFIPASLEDRRQLILRAAQAGLGPTTASRFMDVRNFALGGHTPSGLIHSEEGVRQVLNEIDAHVGDGPL